MEDRDLSRQNALPINDDIFHKRRRRCFFLPCFDKSAGGTASQSSTVPLTWWQKVYTAENESKSSLWSRGLSALKKIREWSEIVAGPRWKTFIRRFNRKKDRHTNFRYDPLSYAMNFDEGNGHFEDDDRMKRETDFSLGISRPGTPRVPWTLTTTGMAHISLIRASSANSSLLLNIPSIIVNTDSI